ncbi:hypothetical protein M422DRAFT_26203 [Sphaerobolus stellatus SS14]|nr:hypothetical protein M422DRAFT_26203 [Sphaerobolus stellatus SS14]
MAPKRLPKLYIVRHGETEWTINGRHTGTSDIPLTANGEAIIRRLGEKAAGIGKLIDPNLITAVLVSPRIRAQKTFDLLWETSEIKPSKNIDERVREWTYGDYEGLLVEQVTKIREEKGLAKGGASWDIWTEGCEGGESVEQMSARVDSVVEAVKKIHKDWVNTPDRKDTDKGGDVVVFSHGHFSRVLLARWLGLPLVQGQLFSLDPGGVCVLQYYHKLERTCVGSMNLGLL